MPAFRAQKSTAPLKHPPQQLDGRVRLDFPCSEEHGPIEAPPLAAMMRLLDIFPCSEEHGPIEAASVNAIAAIRRSLSVLRRARPH